MRNTRFMGSWEDTPPLGFQEGAVGPCPLAMLALPIGLIKLV